MWLSGCSRGPAPTLVGRWLDQKEDAFLSFSEHEWCADVTKSPENVDLYRWVLQGGQLTLTPLTKNWALRVKPPTSQTWTVTLTTDTLRLTSAQGVVRKFKRMPAEKCEPTLVGKWRTKNRWACFGSNGEAMIILSQTKGTKRIPQGKYGEWFQYRVEGNKVRLDGYSPISRRRSVETTFLMQGDNLTFQTRAKERTWKRVQAFDWGEFGP